MKSLSTKEVVWRIQGALERALAAFKPFAAATIKVVKKACEDPVTEAECTVNHILERALASRGVGWFSEEITDDFSRSAKDRGWIVDPLGGTKKFLGGIPVWCVSIGDVKTGVAVAGGIANPITNETFVGSLETGLFYNGSHTVTTARNCLAGPTILASRSEIAGGHWRHFEGGPFVIRPMGSIAYKLARVAAGLAVATWTLTAKHEWDVAAGVALVEAAGVFVLMPDLSRPCFNQQSTLIPGLVAAGYGLKDELMSKITPYLSGAYKL